MTIEMEKKKFKKKDKKEKKKDKEDVTQSETVTSKSAATILQTESDATVVSKSTQTKSKKDKKRKVSDETDVINDSSPVTSDPSPSCSTEDESKIAKKEKKLKKRKISDSNTTSNSDSKDGGPITINGDISDDNDDDTNSNQVPYTHSPITSRPLSSNALEILKKRTQLPCWKAKKKFLDLVKNHPITVLVGETGSGKTTQCPQFLAEKYAVRGGGSESSGSEKKKMIGVCQPRRVAAMSVATRVAEEMDVELGNECGYLIRFEDKTSENTLVKYMTDGMLLREIMTDPLLSNYSVICLDEAHERTLSTDILFGLLKRLLQNERKHDLKVVVMSATLEAEKFQKYFDNAPLITISGRMYPVEIFNTQSAERDYVKASIDIAINICENRQEAIERQFTGRILETDKEDGCTIKERAKPDCSIDGDILIFLTGEEEIETCCKTLEESLDLNEVVILPLYSSLPPQQQRLVFNQFKRDDCLNNNSDDSDNHTTPVKYKRKIVVSTNIAETAVTIDGVVYVIDCGFVKSKVYNPRTHVECLLVNPISKAAAKQRAGRAGRTKPGQCYRIYTQNAHDNSLLEASIPEILRTNLSSAVLTLLKLGIRDVVHFQWIDPPSPESMMRALELLLQLDAVNEEDCSLTEDVGHKLAELPLEPQLGKLLLSGAEFGVSEQMAAIVALLSGAPCQMRPRKFQKQADRAHRQFLSTDGDHTTLLNIFNAYLRVRVGAGIGETVDHSSKNSSKYDYNNDDEADESEGPKIGLKASKSWAYDNYLKDRSLESALSVQKQLIRMMSKLNIPINNKPVNQGENERIAVRKSLIGGFFLQAAHIQSGGGGGKNTCYLTVKDRQTVEIHPSSVLDHKPEWILYHELVLTDKNYVRTCSTVRGEWLLEEAPGFYPTQVGSDEARKGLERKRKLMD